MLARSKVGWLQILGNGKVVWEINLRQRVFDCDVDNWKEFRNRLEWVTLVEGARDQVVWASSSSKRFMCRSFMRGNDFG